MPKKMLHLPALVLFGIYALYGFVFYPLQTKVASDIVLSESFLSYILDFFLPLTEWLGLAAALGFAAYSIYRYGTRRSVPLFILIAGAIVFKSVAYFISYSVLRGSLQFGYHGRNTLASLLLTNLVECLVVALVAVLAHFGTKRLKERNRIKEHACKRLGQTFIPEARSLFSFKNPLLRAILWGLLPFTVFRFFTQYLPAIIVNYRYIDFYWIIIFLFTSILVPAVACFVCALLCIKLTEWYRVRLEARETAEEQSNVEPTDKESSDEVGQQADQ